MTHDFIPRRLSFEYDSERVTIAFDTALTDLRLAGRPLVVLGEAGSGKSDLLRHWGGAGVATARQLVNGWHPSQGRPFVDGLDEAAGLRDGDALDRVLGALQAQTNTDFVLACRIADWRSASAAETIKSWTGVAPVQLTIEPLGRNEIAQFLRQRADFETVTASEFIEHYEQRGLSEWLGNPQTLTMLADVARDGMRPETTGALFEQYVDRAWLEHRKQNGGLASASKGEVLFALGGLFAALIIGGYDVVTLAPGADRRSGDLPLSECRRLPEIANLADGRVEAFLNSRLVIGAGEDRFTYQHRRIGEYLGARWLAAQAATRELRTRLLGALRHNGRVPSSLRGIWGWLAQNEALAFEVIATDPLAVIEYGNADELGPDAAKALLGAIEQAEVQGEAFGWRDYRAAALVQSALNQEVERALARSDETRLWLQMILLQQMCDRAVVARHGASLRGLMLNEQRIFVLRRAAGDALADHGHLIDWPAIITQLADGKVRESLRLALELMLNPNVGLTLDDLAFAETVYAYSGLTPRFVGHREIGTVSLYHVGRRKVIDDERLEGLLNALADCAERYLDNKFNLNAWDAQHLFYSLLERRLELSEVDPEALWRWLRAGGYDDAGGTREARQRIDTWLQAHDELRRALQRNVVDACAENARTLGWGLRRLALGLWPTLDDVIALLDWLPKGDVRWRELIWFTPCRTDGQRARDAAARHVLTEEDSQFLKNHANPPPQDWEIENADRRANEEAERQARRTELRADYFANRDRVRSGEWGALVGLAQVYFGQPYEADNSLPPEQRIAALIGDDLQTDAFEGFKAFLLTEPPLPPSAQQIADSHAQSRSWPTALILVAALAERLREGRGFDDLPVERVQAGLFGEMVAHLDDSKWTALRDALTTELERRGVWAETARTFVEPQLRRRTAYIMGLWRILASDAGTMLAAEWLHSYPRMAAEPEEALIDHLLTDGSAASREALVAVAARRRRSKRLDDRRLHHWQAVELILGTLPLSCLPALAANDSSFLWVLRARMGKRRRDSERAISPSADLLAAIVAAFAPLYPHVSHPSGVTTGDRNPWDATEFLLGCLNALATDPSSQAGAALATLAAINHGYAWHVTRSIADQHRARTNAEWQPHPVDALVELVTDGPPVDHADLQRVLLAEIEVVQTKITSSDADVWRLFYNDPGQLTPKIEDDCSDALITLLRQTARPLNFDREAHLGDNREGDIWCENGSLAVAVECKRHWHTDLWTAFDWQLAQQQAIDWRARDHGVYVIYWFGVHVHAVTGPPRDSGIEKPATPEALECALRQCIADAGLPDIAVKVLDVSRPLQ